MKNISGIPQWLIAIVVTAILIALILISAFIMAFGIAPSGEQESWGQFGDFVGGILNPLFSIIGLLALLHTIFLQSTELARSTKELRSSAKALKRQNKHNAKTQFDNNFFQLLTLNIAQIPHIKLFSDKKIVGEAAFLKSCIVITNFLDSETPNPGQWIEQFNLWHNDNGISFDTYIHSLSNIISFISESSMSKEVKDFAYCSVASNLSSEVLTMFFIFSTFSSEHSWVREALRECEFFDWCQMDWLDYHLIWENIGEHCRVNLDRTDH